MSGNDQATGNIVSSLLNEYDQESEAVPPTLDQVLAELRAGVDRLAPHAFTPEQDRLIELWRRLDNGLTFGAPLPADWQGERDGYVSRHYHVINDPNEQE